MKSESRTEKQNSTKEGLEDTCEKRDVGAVVDLPDATLRAMRNCYEKEKIQLVYLLIPFW